MTPTNTDVDMSGRPVTGNLIIFLIDKKKTKQNKYVLHTEMIENLIWVN